MQRCRRSVSHPLKNALCLDATLRASGIAMRPMLSSSVLRQVHNAFYSFVAPTPTGTEPRLVAASSEVAQLIGLDPAEFDRPEFALIFSGNAPLPASTG